MRIIVCGGRTFSDYTRVARVLNALHLSECIVELIEGGADGADTLARQWAINNEITPTTLYADWDLHGRHLAGKIRNRKMLGLRPDAVVAFPGGPGTRDMVNIATKAGVRVIQG